MAAAVSATTASKPFSYNRATFLFKPISYLAAPPTCFIQTPTRRNGVEFGYRRGKTLTVCLVVEEAKEIGEIESCRDEGGGDEIEAENRITAAALRAKRKKSERFIYLVAAIMSSTGITSLAVMALHYRFWWQMEGGEVPLPEIFTTFVLSLGAAVGMEFWARWAHRALWHASLWYMHESHHRPRDGLFELNDLFAIINAAPAISLLSYGFFTKGLFPGVCFGAGLGITMFGMAYMFVHDGLVHKRFPVGPIGNVPYFKKVAAAHQLHHSDKFNGVPYGLFLGPKVYGDEEWSFGFCDQGTGVFSCPAGKNPMYTYRESIVLGLTNLSIFNVNQIMRDLSREWPGHLYDLLSKNCNHFCDVLCERLGVPKLPGWVNRFANAGDAAMEAAGTTALRLRQARTEIVSASKVAYRYLLGVTSSPDSPNDSNRSSPRVQATWFKNLITSGAKPSSSSDIEDQGGSMLRQNRQNNTESLF